MKRTPFDQAVHDSGYFLSNRENDIAKHFYEAGKAAGDETNRVLLEALEKVKSLNVELPVHVWLSIMDAIAKAKGEQP